MNIILFDPAEVELPLARQDPRALHILNVLRRRVGETFDAGLINGPRGRGTLVTIGQEELGLSFVWKEMPPSLCPIQLFIGMPRPQTARNILRDATSLGVAEIHFVRSEKGEISYASSKLWKSSEWRECVINGAAQAFCTRLPEVTQGRPLADSISQVPAGAARLALDNYEASEALSRINPLGRQRAAIALGSERGWSATERELLRRHGFTFVHLGRRVLRTETACVSAVTLVKAGFNWL